MISMHTRDNPPTKNSINYLPVSYIPSRIGSLSSGKTRSHPFYNHFLDQGYYSPRE